MSEEGDGPRASWRLAAPCFALAVAFTIAQYAIVAGVSGESTPFVSEDWAQLARARSVPSLSAAFDLAREPMRPLQHAFFWELANSGLDPVGEGLPMLARAPAFLFHLASIGLVFALARALGSTRALAACASLLFALYPNVKSLAWPSAIGSPGRVAFELVALNLLVRQAREPRLARGIGAVAAMLLAMGFHESGFLTPAIAGCIVIGSAPSVREGRRRLGDRLREPAFACCTVLVIAYAFYLAMLREQRHNQVKSLDALPANGAKAVFALVPEIVRAPAVDALRGDFGVLGIAIGAVVFVGIVALWMWMLRAGPPLRWAALAVALELALPAIGVGFAQRHAYLAPAFLAIGAVQWIAGRPSRARIAVVVMWGALWAADTLRDAIEYRAVGASARELVELARAERQERGPGVEIAIVDPPDAVGAERDVPLFNWGLHLMFEAYGLEGPWVYWRTYEFHTLTEIERVDPAVIEGAAISGAPPMIRWDPVSGKFRCD